jgi:LemA protein
VKFPFKFGPRGVIVLVIVLVVILILVGWTIVAYNGLVAKQQNVEAQWAQVENQYQRKIDLIPQLVNVTSQYTEFERSTLTNLTELRSRWMNATTIPQQVNLSNLINLMLANLVVTYEAYPYLQSIGIVAGLFDEIAGTENRIAVERGRYNDAVRSYNTSVRSFPDNVVAGWFGFRQAEYYNPIPGGP